MFAGAIGALGVGSGFGCLVSFHTARLLLRFVAHPAAVAAAVADAATAAIAARVAASAALAYDAVR